MRGTAYMANKIGDGGNPCRIQCERENGSDRKLLTCMWTRLQVRKEHSQAQTSDSKPKKETRWIRRSTLMLSKNCTSKGRGEQTYFVRMQHWAV